MIYKDYKPSTAQYMQAVEEYLVRRFGAVQEEWNMVLRLLADNLDIYEDCQKSIKEQGVMIDGRKNPLLPVLRDIQATMSKLWGQLGVTPYASARIRATEEDDSNLLSNLLGVDD